jgi:hypothetical protein
MACDSRFSGYAGVWTIDRRIYCLCLCWTSTGIVPLRLVLTASSVLLMESKRHMSTTVQNAWIRFLRNYGPIPTNDNMYDELIQRSVRRFGVQPIELPASFLDELLQNFRGAAHSYILTGTAGDGKTYHCRGVWLGLGGAPDVWEGPEKIKRLIVGGIEYVFVKDLSELKPEEAAEFVAAFAADLLVADAPRRYLVAANHGQLLEQLRGAAAGEQIARIVRVVEDLIVDGETSDTGVHLAVRDLSRSPSSGLLGHIIEQMTGHPGWATCEACRIRAVGGVCTIWENRRRLIGTEDGGRLKQRLMALVELSERNGVHFPVRHLLALISNAILGHPDATDGLLSCKDVPGIVESGRIEEGAVYRNLFGENLPGRRAGKSDIFRKINAFGIGEETSNQVDAILVYGRDDPALVEVYGQIVLNDSIYGGTPAYRSEQERYLESGEEYDREAFLDRLRAQRQRLFFTIPKELEDRVRLWDLTIFRFGGLYLEAARQIEEGKPLDPRVLPMLVRGLNRVFTGMLMQNQDELVLAMSGSISQSTRSPLLDEIISVPRLRGEQVLIAKDARCGFAIHVRLSPDEPPIALGLTPTRFEFLGRVADGALPSSFSLECQEDILAFKAKLLAGTQRRRLSEGDGEGEGTLLRFVELRADGRAVAKRVMVRT